MLLNQGYVPCDKQIHIKIPEDQLQMIHDRMKQIGVKNMSAYIRKMAVDGYYIHIDFSELLEIIKLMKIDSNNTGTGGAVRREDAADRAGMALGKGRRCAYRRRNQGAVSG